jgi:hypothetical protein
MEVDLRAGFVRFYCQVNLEKYNRLALHRQSDNLCLHTRRLFYGDAFGEIAWLIDIQPAQGGDVICQ